MLEMISSDSSCYASADGSNQTCSQILRVRKQGSGFSV